MNEQQEPGLTELDAICVNLDREGYLVVISYCGGEVHCTIGPRDGKPYHHSTGSTALAAVKAARAKMEARE